MKQVGRGLSPSGVLPCSINGATHCCSGSVRSLILLCFVYTWLAEWVVVPQRCTGESGSVKKERQCTARVLVDVPLLVLGCCRNSWGKTWVENPWDRVYQMSITHSRITSPLLHSFFQYGFSSVLIFKLSGICDKVWCEVGVAFKLFLAELIGYFQTIIHWIIHIFLQ